jgi:hypothetical protein
MMPTTYDTWKLVPRSKPVDGFCSACQADILESASVRRCAGCDVRLCEGCEQHRCEHCHQALCPVCAIYEPDYPGWFCLPCSEALRAKWAAEEAIQ